MRKHRTLCIYLDGGNYVWLAHIMDIEQKNKDEYLYAICIKELGK